MDYKALARKIRDEIFELSSREGAIHGDSVDRVIAEVLEREFSSPRPAWPHAYLAVPDAAITIECSVGPSWVDWIGRPEGEWR